MDTFEQLKAPLQAFADERDWDQFHSPKNLTREQRQAVIDEMADVQVYLLRLATKLDVNLLDAVEQKMVKNAAKYPAEKVKGSSKKYTEYEQGDNKWSSTVPPSSNL